MDLRSVLLTSAAVVISAAGCGGIPQARQDLAGFRSSTQKVQEDQREATERVFSILTTALDTVDHRPKKNPDEDKDK
jgi:hypothetical protein